MEKILVTPLFGMGDTLMATPALKILKEKRPDCHITFFCFNAGTQQILLNNPYIDQLWYYPIKVTHAVSGIVHMLKHHLFRYDTSLNFYPSNRTAYNFFSYICGSKKRVGHRYLNMNNSQMNWLKNTTIEEDPKAHCVEENIRLLRFFDIDPQKIDIPPMQIYLSEEERNFGASFTKPFSKTKSVGIHCGTSTYKGHINRRWPPQRWTEFINMFPDVQFFLYGSLDEVSVNNELKKSVNTQEHVTVVDGKSIREVASIIATMDAFVSNDSGLMHIAAAMKIPTVALLGPTNPNYIYPWGVEHRNIRLNLPCSPCFYYSPRPLLCSIKEQYKCLRELPAIQAANALDELLSLNKEIV